MSAILRMLIPVGLALGLIACSGASTGQASDLHASAMTVEVGWVSEMPTVSLTATTSFRTPQLGHTPSPGGISAPHSMHSLISVGWSSPLLPNLVATHPAQPYDEPQASFWTLERTTRSQADTRRSYDALP